MERGRKAECPVWLLPPGYTGFLISSASWLVQVLSQFSLGRLGAHPWIYPEAKQGRRGDWRKCGVGWVRDGKSCTGGSPGKVQDCVRKDDRPKNLVFLLKQAESCMQEWVLGAKGGVCLHAIKTAREASMGEEWPGSFILVAAVEQPSRAGMSWDQWLGKKGSLVSWCREVSSIIVPGHAVTGKSLPQTFPKQWVSSVPLASHFGQIGKKLQPCLLSYSCHYRNILLTCLIRTQTRSFLCVCETRQNGLLSGIDWCSFPAKFLFQHSIELLRNPQYCSTAVTK